MVCSEDDVVQFLAGLLQKQPALPARIEELFIESALVFIGYGLKDWNIRVMLRAMRGGGDFADSLAVQKRPDDPEGLDWDSSVIYWVKKQNVLCFNMDAVAFIERLAAEYARRYRK